VAGFLWPEAVVVVVVLLGALVGTGYFCLVPFINFENYKIFTHLLILFINF